EAVEKRVHDRSRIFRTPFGLGPLTIVLVVLCVAVWGLMWLRPDSDFANALYITKIDNNHLTYILGLPEIRHGEVWRLITPIFIHAGAVHLIFNVYALFILGTMIEAREGWLRLGSLVVVIAALSNLGQYYMSG